MGALCKQNISSLGNTGKGTGAVCAVHCGSAVSSKSVYKSVCISTGFTHCFLRKMGPIPRHSAQVYYIFGRDCLWTTEWCCSTISPALLLQRRRGGSLGVFRAFLVFLTRPSIQSAWPAVNSPRLAVPPTAPLTRLWHDGWGDLR